MKILLTDQKFHLNFRPLTLTKPIAELRFGILTFKETWAKALEEKNIKADFFYETAAYLNVKYANTSTYEYKIAGNLKPTPQIVDKILALGENESLYCNQKWVATKGETENQKVHIEVEDLLFVEEKWELFQKNHLAMQIDFDLLTKGKTSQNISSTNTIIGKENIFIEEGAVVECSILNATTGPIYIGKDAEVMEGCMVRGGLALLEGATLKMGAKIYGATTIGPHCKVGGEVSNSIFQSFSNKGHDGFLGNSLIGEWCNFGADTNSSNLKNNYSPLKIYNYKTTQLEQTPILFCGVMMGDHSKTGINTMLNTATTVGVSANIFGGEFPPKYISSFNWGGFENSPKFKLEKAFEVAQNMMKRRGINLSEEDKSILTHISENNL